MTQLGRRTQPTAWQLMNHVLEQPALMAALRELPGPILGKLIDEVGLEDAAELVALASTEQLASIFDADLWRAQEGHWEERFDPARFALWLHAFAEAGQDSLIARLLELPVDLLILAVHGLILVLDIDAIAVEMSNCHDDLDQIEKALDNCLYEEWEEFRLIARDDSAWNVISQALLALDQDHHALLRRVLERCAAMSSEWIEDNGGLCEVLTSDQMLEGDVRAERDERRAEKGYVSPADARAFLELARRGLGAPNERDTITKAYFRGLAPMDTGFTGGRGRSSREPSAHQHRLLRLLEQAQVVEPTNTGRLPRPRLRKAAKPSTRTPSSNSSSQMARADIELAAPGSQRLLDQALAVLHGADPAHYVQRIEEIGYLANVLIAASEGQDRRLRPIEALELALTFTDRGLRIALGDRKHSARDSRLTAARVKLATTSADSLFRIGYREVNDASKR